MNKIFISIVSHGHLEVIKSLKCLERLSRIPNVEVVVKENTEDHNTASYCKDIRCHSIINPTGLGFGHNNNEVFNYCKEKLDLRDSDYFLVINPDVDISNESLSYLISTMDSNGIDFACINLFKDYQFCEHDFSVRVFPSLTTFISSLLFGVNKTIYNKKSINQVRCVDWAAGSFLAFKASHYMSLGGFDTSYFMYCEDIDICYRSYMNGTPLTYIPRVKAVHLAQHNNRKVFSKHFYWHVKNAVKFLFKRSFYEWKNKGSI